LAHWDRLTLLLQLQLGDDVTRDWWHQAVEDWTASSNQYAPMGPSRHAALLELLRVRRTDLYDASYVLIESAIARHCLRLRFKNKDPPGRVFDDQFCQRR